MSDDRYANELRDRYIGEEIASVREAVKSIDSPLWLTCMFCREKTHGNTNPEFILGLFGYVEDGITEGAILLKCHLCNCRWPIKVSRS